MKLIDEHQICPGFYMRLVDEAGSDYYINVVHLEGHPFDWRLTTMTLDLWEIDKRELRIVRDIKGHTNIL